MDKIKKLLSIGFIKTMILNFTYFGWGGITHPYIIVSRNTILKKVSGKVFIANKNSRVYFGFTEVGIFDKKYERSIWCNSGIIEFYGNTHFGQGTRLSNSGRIVFGNNFCVNANSTIVCVKEIIFGENVLVSWDVLIMDTDFHKIYLKGNDNSIPINKPKKINIKDNVWIGCRSLILKGTHIQNSTVIAASSTISGIYKEQNVILGSNRIIKQNITWEP